MPSLQDASRTYIVMWMRWVLKYFFFQRNILIGNFLFFSKKYIFFPLSSKLHFVFLLTLHFESFPICFPSYFILSILFQFVIPIYIYIFLYKGDNSWETWLELFQRALLIFECSSTNLRKLTWIHHEKSSPLQIYKCFAFLLLLYI